MRTKLLGKQISPDNHISLNCTELQTVMLLHAKLCKIAIFYQNFRLANLPL